jgi:hypothetical protein
MAPLTTHNTHKRQISINPEGYEPAIPANKIYALDRAATGVDYFVTFTKLNRTPSVVSLLLFFVIILVLIQRERL